MTDKPTVVCGTCGTVHEGFLPGQADGCAATVTGDRLVGHYGSGEIDLEAWVFVGSRPEEVQDGDICDECIAGLKRSGAIALSERAAWS